MSRTYGKAQDLIDFTRASSGTALRRVKYGAELVTNGGFDTDSDWTKGVGWSISGGVAVSSGSNNYGGLQQTASLTAGKVYSVTFTISSYTSGSLKFAIGSTTGNLYSSAGTFTENFVYIEPHVSGKNVSIFPWGAFVGTIDNVSVKEVTFDTSDGDLILFNHPNNIPRIEYDVQGNVLGLLVEESRTNIIRYSENFSLWSTNGSITRTISSTPSPDGQLNAYDVTDSGSGDEFIARYDTIPTTVTSYVSTVFAEKTSGDAHYLNIANFIYGGSGQYLHATFNTNTGEFTAVSGISISSDTFVEDRGSYWRIGIKVTNTGANNTFQVRLYPAYNSDGGTARNASTTGSKTLFGVQLEAGSFPTSYIPNYGTSGGVTRSADVASLSTSAFGYRQDEGVVFVEFSGVDDSGTGRLVSITDNTGNNSYAVQQVNGSTTSGRIRVGGVDYMFGNKAAVTTGKAALLYSDEYAQFVLNGSAVAPDTSVATATMTVLGVGNNAGASNATGHIKSVKYYPRKLTESQLEALTA